ncbi:MAG: hypothetical protein ACRC10_03170 [Thermoguttaceae bacterium]
MIDIDTLTSNNWRQCSVFPLDATAEIADRLPIEKDELVNGSCWLVFSHSCDINSKSQSETHIEILLLTPIAEQNNSYIHGKHPRFYHLEINGRWYEAQIDNRFRIDRDFCARYVPCPTTTVSAEDNRSIVQWITYRYVRSAFPDEFNERIKRKKDTKDKLKKLLEKGESQLLSGLFISISTNDELPEETDYEVQLLGLMNDLITEYDRKVATTLVKEFADLLNSCKGIDVSCECLQTSDVTLAKIQLYQRFTDYDYLSYDASET